jgi:hypothetical protein
MTSPYDPDPALSSGAISGFNEYAAIYTNYKVLGLGYVVSLASREKQPLQVALAPTRQDVGTNFVGLQEFPEVPYGRAAIVSASGGMDRCTLSGKIDLVQFIGKQYLYDADYNGIYNSNPTNNLYLNVGFQGLNVLEGGCITDIRLYYHVLFFGRRDVFN